MKNLKYGDLTYKSQLTIDNTRDRLNNSSEKHKTIIEEYLNLKPRADEDKINLNLVPVKAIFKLVENEDGLKSYIFSHAEMPE